MYGIRLLQVFQMKILVLQSKYLVFRSKPLNFDRTKIEILGFSHLKFEILGNSTEIPITSKKVWNPKPSTVKASSDCKMSERYLRGTDQRYCVVNIYLGTSAKFLHPRIWKCHISPRRQTGGKTIWYNSRSQKDDIQYNPVKSDSQGTEKIGLT